MKTYTHALSDIDKGHVWKGKPAPAVGINYWKLSKDATMRDLILAIRADEACHSHVNHCLSELKVCMQRLGPGIASFDRGGGCNVCGHLLLQLFTPAFTTCCIHNAICAPSIYLPALQMHDENPFAATNSGSQPETKPPKASLGVPDA